MPEPDLADLVRLEPEATRDASRALMPPSATCCSACSTFRVASARGLLPTLLQQQLATAGARMACPVEVWGAPDGGFLSARWWLVGSALADLAAAPAWQDPATGCTWRVKAPSSNRTGSSFEQYPTVELELIWSSTLLEELERTVWPPAETA